MARRWGSLSETAVSGRRSYLAAIPTAASARSFAAEAVTSRAHFWRLLSAGSSHSGLGPFSHEVGSSADLRRLAGAGRAGQLPVV
jgi:hypothetical protein